MEDIVETKGIEKVDDVEVKEIDQEASGRDKPKRKPRTEAQKAAFEKARKKRAENLAKKKLEEEDEVSIDESHTQTQSSASNDNTGDSNSPEVSRQSSKAPPKKRGRPKGSKKLKREPEPVAGQPNFLPRNIPPEAGDLRYQYQQHNPYQFNPMMMYQPPPQVHNYYYGHQQGAVHQQPREPPPPQRPPSPEVDSSSEEEVEQYIEYPQETYQAPTLKYRFA